jgi:AraC-like DNA-binding protein
MRASFDTWTSIFLFAAIQGVFVSGILLLRNKPFSKERLLLPLITLLFSLTLIDYVLYWTHYNYYFPQVTGLTGGFTFLYGPLFYYYFRGILEDKKLKWIDLLSLIPFMVFTYERLPWILSSAEFKRQFMRSPHTVFHFPIWAWISILSMCIYGAIIYIKYKPLSKSNPQVSRWFNYIYAFYIGYVLSFLSYYVLVLTPWYKVEYDYMISFAMSFFIYFLAWFGYMQPKVFEGFSVKEIIKPPKYSSSTLKETATEEILSRLTALMNVEKLYRKENITLDSISEIMGVPKHHLSQVINSRIGLSYFDYINSLRVKEAAEILASTSKREKNIIETAYDCGFSNKASFNSAFKKFMHVTPTQFRENHGHTGRKLSKSLSE